MTFLCVETCMVYIQNKVTRRKNFDRRMWFKRIKLQKKTLKLYLHIFSRQNSFNCTEFTSRDYMQGLGVCLVFLINLKIADFRVFLTVPADQTAHAPDLCLVS